MADARSIGCSRAVACGAAAAIFRADAALQTLARSRMATRSHAAASSSPPLVGVIMGSRSDLRVMSHAGDVLTALEVPHEMRVVSAHRTPDWMFEYASGAEARGLEVIIAAA